MLRRRSAAAGLGVLLLFLYAGWIAYQWQRDKLYDFNLYYIAASGLRDGLDIYDLARDYSGENAAAWAELAEAYGVEHYAPPYRYPPLTAQLVLPLTYLDDRTAGTLWLLLSGLAFAASAWLMGKVSHAPQGPAIALGLMLVFVPALTTLHAGQVNGFVLLTLTAGYWGLERRNDLAAGIGIAVAALPALSGWQYVTLISPIFVLILIGRVSGVPLLEAKADRKWGGREDYEQYKASTPVLVPRPPRSRP